MGLSKIDFIGTLFYPEDLIEIRLVEQWEVAGKRRNKVLRTYFCRAEELPPETVDELGETCSNIHRPVHVFMGVCPRSREGGKAEDVALARCVWADLDYVRPDAALAIVKKKKLPKPSIVVDSGHGTHLYWLLKEPVAFTSPDDRAAFQAVVAGVGRLVGGDHTHDLSRLLRLPGTANCKRFPWPWACVRDHLCSFGVYDLDEFRPHAVKPKSYRPVPEYVPSATWAGLSDRQREAAEAAIARSAAAPVGTRSEVDYATLVWLAKLGLGEADVWERVRDVGKFADGGERYFTATWRKASAAAQENIDGPGVYPGRQLDKQIRKNLTDLYGL